MNDMSSSNMSVSISRVTGAYGRRAGGGAAPAGAGFKFSWDDSGLSLNNKRKNNNSSSKNSSKSSGFKFSWDDSCTLSVDTEDLEESDSSFLQLGNYTRSKKVQAATPLGKVLEQVDGVKYKQPEPPKLEDNHTRRAPGGLGLLSPFDEDSDESEEDLFLPAAAAPAAKPVAKAAPPKPVEPPAPETTIKFQEPLVTHRVDFVQDEDAALAIWNDDHVAQDHNQIPWDELDYEELPWHLQPDLDEDDELTKRVKVVLGLGKEPAEGDDDDQEEEDQNNYNRWCSGEEDETPLTEEEWRKVDRVEAWVIHFVLRLQYKRLERKAGGGAGKAKNLEGDEGTLNTSANTSISSLESNSPEISN